MGDYPEDFFPPTMHAPLVSFLKDENIEDSSFFLDTIQIMIEGKVFSHSLPPKASKQANFENSFLRKPAQRPQKCTPYVDRTKYFQGQKAKASEKKQEEEQQGKGKKKKKEKRKEEADNERSLRPRIPICLFSPTFSLRDVDALELARQITLITADHFRALKVSC